MFEQRPAPELADLLATHVAENDDELHRIKRVIVGSLEGCSLEDTFDRTLWFFENPNTRRFIPESLARLLIAAAEPKQDKVETQDGGSGPKPGQRTPKARACEIALEILKKRQPELKHGWKIYIATQVHEALIAEGFPHGRAWVEKTIRPTINEWASRNRKLVREASGSPPRY